MATSTPLMISFETGLAIIFFAGIFLSVIMLLMYLLFPVTDSV